MTSFLIAADNGKAFSISLPASAPLGLATVNTLDRNQHWQLVPSSDGSVFIVARNGQTFDVTGSRIAEGNPVNIYNKKKEGADSTNQRFLFKSPGNINVVNSKLNVIAVSDTKIVLSAKSQTFTTIPIPTEYPVTVTNNYPYPIQVTYDNAPASEDVKSWTVPAGGSVTIQAFEGAALSVRDEGKPLGPPTIVSKPVTVSVDPEPAAKLILFSALGATGEKLEYNTEEPDLVKKQWNDKPRSFQVVSGSWIIYQDWYTGNKIVANRRGGKNLDGIYNDQIWGGHPATLVGITSFRPLPDNGLALFAGYNFEGASVNVNEDVPNLSDPKYAFDNKLLSLVLVSGIWELWDRPGYQGARRIITIDGGRDGTGFFNLPNQWGGRANSIMSIRRYVPGTQPFPAQHCF